MVRTTNDFIFPPKEIDEKMMNLLQELYDLKPEIHEDLSFKDFVHQYKARRESSSVSFDGYVKSVVYDIRKLKYASFRS